MLCRQTTLIIIHPDHRQILQFIVKFISSMRTRSMKSATSPNQNASKTHTTRIQKQSNQKKSIANSRQSKPSYQRLNIRRLQMRTELSRKLKNHTKQQIPNNKQAKTITKKAKIKPKRQKKVTQKEAIKRKRQQIDEERSNDIIESSLSSKQEIYEVNSLFCPICELLFVRASEIQCGHMFCKECLADYMLGYDQCPICERPIEEKEVHNIKKVDEIVQEFVQTLDEQEKQNFADRIKKMKERGTVLKPENFEVGTQVDIRDKKNFWQRGIITRKHTRMQNQERVIKLLSVMYIETRLVDEVEPSSERLAKKGFYTDRPYFPRFMHNMIQFEGAYKNDEMGGGSEEKKMRENH